MAGGLLAGYGTFAGYALRYLYPAHARDQEWLLVAPIARLAPGAALAFTAPDGQKIAIARHGEGETGADFVALGSTCPHLGCQVRWEPQNNRFFCPCHNGEFNPQGKGIGGPPGKAGQSLPRFPLKVEYGILYIQVPLESLPRPA
jgi:Rieske Fe-S protein